MLDKDKLAEMPKPENPYNYQDLFDSRVAFWEGAQAQRELLWKQGWRRVRSAEDIAQKMDNLISDFEVACVAGTRQDWSEFVAERLQRWLMEGE